MNYAVNKNEDNASDSNVLAQISPEAFKAMFYFYAGRPDTKIKTFLGRKTISPQNIKFLNSDVVEKLRNHSIEAIVTSIGVKLHKGEFLEFGIWHTFENYNWNINRKIEQIGIKWDFLLKTNDLKIAQRHTLIVKLSNGIGPRDFFQLLTTQWEEGDDIEINFSPCIAKVDFISHILADELISIVANWFDGLPDSNCADAGLSSLKKHDEIIANTIHYSVLVFFWLSIFSFAYSSLWGTTEEALTFQSFRLGILVILICIIGSFIFSRIGNHLGKKCHSAINKSCDVSIFNFTSADRNFNEKCIRKNKKTILKFIFNSLLAVILNVISAVVSYYLFRYK